MLRVQSRKGRQKRRMNVEDLVRKLGYELSAQKAHVPGQADQVDPLILEHLSHFGVECSTLYARRRQGNTGETERPSVRQTRGLRLIRENQTDLAFELTGRDIPLNGSEVRTAAGQENT